MLFRLAGGILLLSVLAIAACAPMPASTQAPAAATYTPAPAVEPTPSLTAVPPTVTTTRAPVKLPRTFILDPRVLADAKIRLAAGDKTLEPALKKLLSEANSALNFKPGSVMDKAQVADSGDKHDYLSLARYYWPDPAKPNGLPYLSRDGEPNPEMDTITDKLYFDRVTRYTGTLALAFYFTSDERCAQKAAEILRVWFLNADTRMNPNGTYAQVQKGRGVPTGSGIIDFVDVAQLVDYINLLDGSKAWTPADQQGMVKWMDDFLTWLTTSKPGIHEGETTNNHSVYYDTQVVAYALFVGKDERAKQVLEQAKAKRIAAQIEPDGRQPRELARTLSMHYTIYNLNAFVRLAAEAERVNIDLWNYQTQDGRSIRKALDFVVPFLAGEQKWTYPELSPFSNSQAYPLFLLVGTKYKSDTYARLGFQLATEDLTTARFLLTSPGLALPASYRPPTPAPTNTPRPLPTTAK